MPTLKFVLGLVVALALQAGAVWLFPDAPRGLDLLLVLVVLNALDNGSLGGLLGGLVAGLAHDALTGGLYGMHGFAKTLVGYLAGSAAQRFMVQQPLPVLLAFALGAALHEALLTLLAVLIYARPEIPPPAWLLLKVGTTASLGLVLFLLRRRLLSQQESWRRSRTSRLKLGRS